MEGPSPHFEVVWLLNNAALVSPETLEGKDQVLEGHKQSSTRPGSGGNGLALNQEMRCEANRIARGLSSNIPSVINGLWKGRPEECAAVVSDQARPNRRTTNTNS